MRVAITGEQGFLGYHLTQYYKWIKNDEVISLGRNYLDNISLLKECDLLIHCAGINRGDNVYHGNISLTNDLVNALKNHNISIDIKFTSSTQEDLDNDYGNSKRECSAILSKYCLETNSNFKSYKIPNIFGPFGKPHYNSFINTFCYNLINNIPINYNDNIVSLCYVYDVIKSIDNNTPFNITNISVKDVYFKLKSFHEDYSKGIIPNLTIEFDKNLFNTYRSFTSPEFTFNRHTDDRGYLVELVKGKGSETQMFFSTTKPGITRGNHFHFNKVERFCILKGEAKVTMRKIGTNIVEEYYIDGDSNKVIDMPVLYTHDITNVGKDDLICVFWVDEIYDHSNPDTYYEKVKK